MISFTAEARADVVELERYYHDLGRDAAIVRLGDALARGIHRINTMDGPFQGFPRPYPDVASYGWLWFKEWRYWIAFAPTVGGHAITAVFHEQANIPVRLGSS